MLYRPAGQTGWRVLGRNLPTTSAMQFKTGLFGLFLYAAIHGRGIRSYDLWHLLFLG